MKNRGNQISDTGTGRDQEKGKGIPAIQIPSFSCRSLPAPLTGLVAFSASACNSRVVKMR